MSLYVKLSEFLYPHEPHLVVDERMLTLLYFKPKVCAISCVRLDMYDFDCFIKNDFNFSIEFILGTSTQSSLTFTLLLSVKIIL